MFNNYNSLIHQSAGPKGDDPASKPHCSKNCDAVVEATLGALPTEEKLELKWSSLGRTLSNMEKNLVAQFCIFRSEKAALTFKKMSDDLGAKYKCLQK